MPAAMPAKFGNTEELASPAAGWNWRTHPRGEHLVSHTKKRNIHQRQLRLLLHKLTIACWRRQDTHTYTAEASSSSNSAPIFMAFNTLAKLAARCAPPSMG